MMAVSDGPIGLFDSGIGGCTVLHAIQQRLPQEHLLYLADQAHCPYGPRSAEELRLLSSTGVRWLIANGAKLVVMACNSASAAALGYLRETFPETPFVGMVPAVKPATLMTRSGIIGVLATPATINGGLLRDVVAHHAGHVRVLLQACAGLAEAIETHDVDHPTTHDLIEQYVTPLIAAGADTLVLGCTHYPLLAAQIRAIAGQGVALIDPAPAIAEQAARLLSNRGILQQGQSPALMRFATTGDPQRLVEQLNRLRISPIVLEEYAYVLEDSLVTRHPNWP